MKFESTTCKSKALLLTAVNNISFFNGTLCVATTVQFFSELAVAGTDLVTHRLRRFLHPQAIWAKVTASNTTCCI